MQNGGWEGEGGGRIGISSKIGKSLGPGPQAQCLLLGLKLFGSFQFWVLSNARSGNVKLLLCLPGLAQPGSLWLGESFLVLVSGGPSILGQLKNQHDLVRAPA